VRIIEYSQIKEVMNRLLVLKNGSILCRFRTFMLLIVFCCCCCFVFAFIPKGSSSLMIIVSVLKLLQLCPKVYFKSTSARLLLILPLQSEAVAFPLPRLVLLDTNLLCLHLNSIPTVVELTIFSTNWLMAASVSLCFHHIPHVQHIVT